MLHVPGRVDDPDALIFQRGHHALGERDDDLAVAAVALVPCLALGLCAGAVAGAYLLGKGEVEDDDRLRLRHALERGQEIRADDLRVLERIEKRVVRGGEADDGRVENGQIDALDGEMRDVEVLHPMGILPS